MTTTTKTETERPIDRLEKWLQERNIGNYPFEQKLKLANGYVNSQKRGKGTINSEVLVKILNHYPEMDIIYLLTGEISAPSGISKKGLYAIDHDGAKPSGKKVGKAHLATVNEDNIIYNTGNSAENLLGMLGRMIDGIDNRVKALEKKTHK